MTEILCANSRDEIKQSQACEARSEIFRFGGGIFERDAESIGIAGSARASVAMAAIPRIKLHHGAPAAADAKLVVGNYAI